MKNSSDKEQGAKAPVLPTSPTDRIDREQIKQEIRELDSLRMDGQLDDIVYHRINELLEMLDNDNG